VKGRQGPDVVLREAWATPERGAGASWSRVGRERASLVGEHQTGIVERAAALQATRSLPYRADGAERGGTQSPQGCNSRNAGPAKQTGRCSF